MANTLYISYTALMDPLGQSQVLQYILGLSKEHTISVISFEKADNLGDREKLGRLRNRLDECGIEWRVLRCTNRFSLLGKMLDIAKGAFIATQVAQQSRVHVVHCRSYIASIMGLAVKARTGAAFIFDMRGFWPDERVDVGIWTRNGIAYHIFKAVEKQLFLNADHVVSLTRAGVREFSRFDYLEAKVPPYTVIPTCTNLDLFSRDDKLGSFFTLGYIGSVGSWYMFDQVAFAVSRLFKMRSDARFLVVNKGGHAFIRDKLSEAGVDLERVEIVEAPFDKVGDFVSRMDAGIFFIKPVWSKRASCPTRMGEFLACGKPCLANVGVGDVKEDFEETRTGITVEFDKHNHIGAADIDMSLRSLTALASDPGVSRRCREAAVERFSLNNGIKKYSQIYKDLGRGRS
tara:strand:- start:9083 stop:10291 length:1209 start_codon:yes stop_codon:yes gene_type:complete